MTLGGPPLTQSAPKTAPRTSKHSNRLATLEGGSTQILKQPQKKKKRRVPRHTIKARPHSRRRPPKNPAQQKLGKGKSHASGNLKTSESTVYTPSPETRLRKCYCGLLSSLAKNPLESGLRSVPPKVSKPPNLGQPNSLAAKAEERKVPIKQGGKVEPLAPHLAEKPKETSGARENNRKLNPITPGKRRYKTVSVYQFIYPERSMYLCNRETVKQQLRAIYLNNRQQIKHHRTTVSQPEVNPSQRGSNGSDPRCPMGCEFLRSIQNSLTSQGLPNLMCRINNLGLVSGKPQATSPHIWEGKEHLSQAHYSFASKQLSLLVEGLQRPNSPETHSSPEGYCDLGQGHQAGMLLQENVFTALGWLEPPEPSPLLNKDCKVKGPEPTLGEKNQHVVCPEEEDDSQSAHCNVETTHAKRTIGDQLSSSSPHVS